MDVGASPGPDKTGFRDTVSHSVVNAESRSFMSPRGCTPRLCRELREVSSEPPRYLALSPRGTIPRMRLDDRFTESTPEPVRYVTTTVVSSNHSFPGLPLDERPQVEHVESFTPRRISLTPTPHKVATAAQAMATSTPMRRCSLGSPASPRQTLNIRPDVQNLQQQPGMAALARVAVFAVRRRRQRIARRTMMAAPASMPGSAVSTPCPSVVPPSPVRPAQQLFSDVRSPQAGYAVKAARMRAVAWEADANRLRASLQADSLRRCGAFPQGELLPQAQHVLRMAMGKGGDSSTLRHLAAEVPEGERVGDTTDPQQPDGCEVTSAAVLAAAADAEEAKARAEAAAAEAAAVREALQERAARRRMTEELLATRGCIRVFGRMRGASTEGDDFLLEELPPASMLVQTSRQGGPNRFDFHGVIGPNCLQAEVFEEVIPLIDAALLSDASSCILAYGATGSGKTHTMVGSEEARGGAGIIPRALERLFAPSSASSSAPRIGVSVAEVYRERIHDLLAGGAVVDAGAAFANTAGNVSPRIGSRSLSSEYPRSAVDALSLCASAFRRRRTHATAKNDRSSRSHLLVLLSVAGGGRLLLVDLAGAERQDAGALDRSCLAEACGINRSLVALGKVVASTVARESGREVHVPYRDSPLTRLLEGFVNCTARTLLIAHTSAGRAAEDMRETLRTLTFAVHAGGCLGPLTYGAGKQMSCPGAILQGSLPKAADSIEAALQRPPSPSRVRRARAPSSPEASAVLDGSDYKADADPAQSGELQSQKRRKDSDKLSGSCDENNRHAECASSDGASSPRTSAPGSTASIASTATSTPCVPLSYRQDPTGRGHGLCHPI